MRIAIVTTSWPASEADPGGHFVRASARELERQGHEVVTVAPRAGGAFGWPGVAARLRDRPHRVFEAALWIVRARAQVARVEADRVVAHWAVPCAWPIAVASRRSLEVVSHGGDVRLLVALPVAARRHVVRTIASRASQWTFASDALMHELLSSLERADRLAAPRIALVRGPAPE